MSEEKEVKESKEEVGSLDKKIANVEASLKRLEEKRNEASDN